MKQTIMEHDTKQFNNHAAMGRDRQVMWAVRVDTAKG